MSPFDKEYKGDSTERSQYRRGPNHSGNPPWQTNKPYRTTTSNNSYRANKTKRTTKTYKPAPPPRGNPQIERGLLAVCLQYWRQQHQWWAPSILGLHPVSPKTYNNHSIRPPNQAEPKQTGTKQNARGRAGRVARPLIV